MWISVRCRQHRPTVRNRFYLPWNSVELGHVTCCWPHTVSCQTHLNLVFIGLKWLILKVWHDHMWRHRNIFCCFRASSASLVSLFHSSHVLVVCVKRSQHQQPENIHDPHRQSHLSHVVWTCRTNTFCRCQRLATWLIFYCTSSCVGFVFFTFVVWIFAAWEEEMQEDKQKESLYYLTSSPQHHLKTVSLTSQQLLWVWVSQSSSNNIKLLVTVCLERSTCAQKSASWREVNLKTVS